MQKLNNMLNEALSASDEIAEVAQVAWPRRLYAHAHATTVSAYVKSVF